jgi:flagellar hook-basal body complex protein FliE
MDNAISALRILPADTSATTLARPAGAQGGFTQTLASAMDEVETAQGDAQSRVTELLKGNGMDVHSAMIAVEKADLSFQLMMQVRNKIVAAYQEVSRMQF